MFWRKEKTKPPTKYGLRLTINGVFYTIENCGPVGIVREITKPA